MKATSNYMHNQLLSPLLNILPINYFITTMFGTRDKKAGNLTRKSHEKIMQHTATNLTRKFHNALKIVKSHKKIS
jgi:hypothetical protein